MVCSGVSAIDGGTVRRALLPAGRRTSLADRVRAFNGEATAWTAQIAQPARGIGACGAGRRIARRGPRSDASAVVLGLHLVVWTVLPILVCANLQLDLAEDLALGKEWQLGYWKHPPLPWWIADLLYRLTGSIDAIYVLGPLAAVLCFYGVWLLAREVIGDVRGADRSARARRHPLLQFLGREVRARPDAAAVLGVHRRCSSIARCMRGRLLDWALAGAFLAGAFWSKYAAFALAATLGLFLLFDPMARRAWRTPGPYVMALAFAIVIAPNVWWLVAHDFLPFHYVDERARAAAHWYQYMHYPLQWTGEPAAVPAAGSGAARPRSTGHWRTAPRRRRHDEVGLRSTAAMSTALALGPFLVTTVVAAVLGRLAVAMWGYPLWSFAPLAALLWLRPAARRAPAALVRRRVSRVSSSRCR